MKVTVLGCGGSAGVPMIGGADGPGTGLWGNCDPDEPRNRRTRASIVLEEENGFRLLVDSGPDFRAQMLVNGLSRIDAVLYTHPHADHIAGLDDLRSVNRALNAPLPLFAAPEVLDELKRRFAYAFVPWHGPDYFRPVFEERIVGPGDGLDLPGLEVRVFGQRHGRIVTLGLRAGDFAYSTDVETLTEPAFAALEGVKVWMVDCFQYGPHHAHAWLDRVLEWRERLRPERTILTHMGPEMDYATLKRDLPPGMEPAFDGMVLRV